MWAYDLVTARTHEGRPLKILTVVDAYSRECLVIVVARRVRSLDVLETLAELFVIHGVPAHRRSDNGPEFTAALVRHWLAALNVETLLIEPGSPWENGYVESFHGKLRDELVDREIFYTRTEAQILIERWRREDQHGAATQCVGRSPPGPGQDFGDDHTRSVDRNMELLPATRAASAVFRGGPFAFADYRESRAVDDEVHGFAPGDSTKGELEVLAAPRERRMIGRGQIEAHQPEERRQEPPRSGGGAG